MAINKKNIQWRSFTTFSVVLIFIIISITGLVLYITPPGRVANWTGWKLFFLTKAQWQSIHTNFSFLFLVAAAFHIYFNWKVLVGYIKSKIEESMKYKKELSLSLATILVILVLTISNLPPFETVMAIGEDFKNGWTTEQNEPPIPHAELLSLKAFAEKTNMPLEQLKQQLHSANIFFAGDSATIQQIADANTMTPQEIFKRIGNEQLKQKSKIVEGGGYGRKTIMQISIEMNVPIEEAMKRLKEKSIEANAETIVRDVATKNGVSPVDVVKTIANEL